MLVIRGRLGRVVVSADFTCSVIHANACTMLTCILHVVQTVKKKSLSRTSRRMQTVQNRLKRVIRRFGEGFVQTIVDDLLRCMALPHPHRNMALLTVLHALA